MLTLVSLAISALLSTSVIAQGDLTETNNVTSLEGTWSSNSAVSTGGVSYFFMTAVGCLSGGEGELGHRSQLGPSFFIALQ